MLSSSLYLFIIFLLLFIASLVFLVVTLVLAKRFLSHKKDLKNLQDRVDKFNDDNKSE